MTAIWLLKSPKRIKDTPLKGKWFVNNVYYLEHNPKLPANSCKRCPCTQCSHARNWGFWGIYHKLKGGYSMPEMKVFLKGSICPVVSEKWRKLWRIEGSNRAQKSAGLALFEKGALLNSVCGVTTHLSGSLLSWSVVDVAGLFFFCRRSLNHEKRERENLYERNCLTIDTEHAQCWTHDQWRRSENSRVLLYGSNWKQVSYGSDDSFVGVFFLWKCRLCRQTTILLWAEWQRR